MSLSQIGPRLLLEAAEMRRQAAPSLRQQADGLFVAVEAFVAQYDRAVAGLELSSPPAPERLWSVLSDLDELAAGAELIRVLRLTALVGGAARVAYYAIAPEVGYVLGDWASWVSVTASGTITSPLRREFPELETCSVDVTSLHSELASLART